MSFSPVHRWEVRVQERFPTYWVHKSPWKLPLSIPPAALKHKSHVCRRTALHFSAGIFVTGRMAFIGVFFSGRSMLVLGWEVCGTQGRNLEVCWRTDRASSLQHLTLLSPVFSSSRQNTRVGRQLVPKLLEESSSWPLVCSEVGWIDCAAVETQGQGPGVEGHTTGCCRCRRMREIFMFCGASFPALEKAFILCVCVNAL